MKTVPPKWVYAQPALFDAQAAEIALNDAVERVEAHASAEWMAACMDAIRLVAEHRQELTTDSVWAVLSRWQIEEPHESRAMGAAMRKARTSGWITPTHQTSRSVRPACHRRDLRVWSSLITTTDWDDMSKRS